MRTGIRRALLLAVVALVASPVAAQIEEPVTMLEAYSSALSDNPGLQSQRFTYRAEKDIVREAWGQVLPQLTATGSYGISDYTRELGAGQSFSDRETVTQVNVQLSQVIYSRRTFQGIKRAEAGEKLAEAELSDRRMQIGYRAIEAYLEALRLRDEVEVVEESLASYEWRGRQLDSMQERGLASRVDLLDARARIDEAKAELAALRYDLRAALKKLESITGLNVSGRPLASLSMEQWRRTPKMLSSDWQQIALTDAPEVSRAQRELQVASATRREAEGLGWPELSLRVHYSANDTFATTIQEEYRGELELRVPLYTGGSASAWARAASKRERSAEYALRNQENEVQVQISRLTEKLEGSYRKIKALESALASAKAAFEAAEEGFASGVRSLNQLLDSRNRLTEIRRSMINQTYDNAKGQFELRRQAGVLSSQNLRGL
jgi:outer membrane protein